MDYVSIFRGRVESVKERDKEEKGWPWVYGFYCEGVDCAGKACWIYRPAADPDDRNRSWYVIRDTVGRFTGLQDVNGVDVYEGDIVEAEDEYSTVRGVVRFGRIPTAGFGFHGNHIGFYIAWADDGANRWSEWWRCDIGFWIEENGAYVVGNIYDNADLLPDAGED